MRVAFAALIGIHALLHLIGPAKAFGWANVQQLQAPISPVGGALWLIAALLLGGAAIGMAAHAPWWWWPAVPGLLLSQGLIIQAWGDAKFGTVINVLVLLAVVLVLVDMRPSSFRSRFVRDRDALLARPATTSALVTDADLVRLPTLMQSYLRRVGAVGRPHVRNLRVQFNAQMRASATSAWMPAIATEYAHFDSPARLFYMNATRAGVPMDIYHCYLDGAATFQVRVASLMTVVDKSGPVLTRAETVTLMNDVIVMAPAAVLDLPFTWKEGSDRSVVATFTNAGNTVAATLFFNADGDLVGFVSNDRTQEGALGSRSLPWSTPISGYRDVDGIRVAAHGEANWIEPSGEWTYGRFEIRSIAYNVTK